MHGNQMPEGRKAEKMRAPNNIFFLRKLLNNRLRHNSGIKVLEIHYTFISTIPIAQDA